MQLPSTESIIDFILNYGFAFFSVLFAGVVCLGCLMYMFGVLCDRNPKVAKGITICVWVLTFVQSFLLFITYPFYVPLLAILHHFGTIPLVLKIPTITIFSIPFYIVTISTGISQLLVTIVFILGSYQLHEYVLVFITFQSVSFLVIASIQLNGERVVSSELSQSYNIAINLAQKILQCLHIRGGVLHKNN